MIRARHRSFYIRFFNFYTKWMLKRYFREIRFRGDMADKGLPVLMIGNHFSWWDGFIANYLNLSWLHRRIHVMMLEDQLKDRKFLNYAGAFSISKGNRSVKESLNYAAGLLKIPENLVVIYPQGRFQSLYERPVKFEKGISFIAKESGCNYQFIFYAAFPDYFEHARPVLTIHFREVMPELALGPVELESEYNRFMEESISFQKPE